MSSSSRSAELRPTTEFGAFMKKHGAESVVIVDARNPDFEVEPGDRGLRCVICKSTLTQCVKIILK